MQILADSRFEEMMAQFIADNSLEYKPKQEFFSVDYNKKFFWDIAKKNNVFFGAMHMCKAYTCVPDTSFIYFNYPAIPSWKMLCSKQIQEDILLTWVVPTSYDYTQPLEIIFYILVDEKSVKESAANISILVDVKDHKKCLASQYVLQTSTGNFLVQKSDALSLELHRVQATVVPHIIKPQDVLLLVFNRVAPIGNVKEYGEALYLHSVTLEYEVL